MKTPRAAGETREGPLDIVGFEVRYEEQHEKPWAIYWRLTNDLASPRRFATIHAAAPYAKMLLEEHGEQRPLGELSPEE